MSQSVIIANAAQPKTLHSEGAIVTPGAGALLADTGPQAAGTYDFEIQAATNETTNGKVMTIERRDAANAVTLFAFAVPAIFYAGTHHVSLPLTLAANERVRVITTGGGTVGAVYSAVIMKQGV